MDKVRVRVRVKVRIRVRARVMVRFGWIFIGYLGLFWFSPFVVITC
jgi:hypothetical protein